jgi:hypothetical protein
MPVQSAVEQSALDQPLPHVHAATPLPVSQLPPCKQLTLPQFGAAQSLPAQPAVQVHSAAPLPVSQLP